MYPTPETIIRAVAAVFPVTPEEITGPGRQRNQVDARSVVAYLVQKQLRMSNRQTVELLGRHCRSIAVSYRRRHDDLYTADKQYRNMVDRVIRLLEVGTA